MVESLIKESPMVTPMGIENRFTEEDIKRIKGYEDSEIDRFLHEELTCDKVLIYIPEINDSIYEAVQKATKNGIKKGIEDFLKNQEIQVSSLYLSKIGELVYTNYVIDGIKDSITQFSFNASDVSDYSEHFGRLFGTWVYQKSYDTFVERFLNYS